MDPAVRVTLAYCSYHWAPSKNFRRVACAIGNRRISASKLRLVEPEPAPTFYDTLWYLVSEYWFECVYAYNVVRTLVPLLEFASTGTYVRMYTRMYTCITL